MRDLVQRLVIFVRNWSSLRYSPTMFMGTWRVLVVLALAVALHGPSTAAELTGKAKVVDGRTLEVAGQRLRLQGIDAPDLSQTCQWPGGKTIPCGNMSRTAMMDLVAGTDVQCQLLNKKADGVALARCAADGFDIAGNMAYTGWALADRRVTSRYVRMEETARKRKHGMWRGQFIPPWDWRAGKR